MSRRLAFWLVAAVVGSAGCVGQSGSQSAPLTTPSALSASVAGRASATTYARRGGGGGGGKKAGAGGGTLVLVMVSDVNGDGKPNWGDIVTFDVATTATNEPTVELLCAQNGTNVYGSTAGFYDGYAWPWTKNMTLSSSAWQSGAADCTATLFPMGDRRSVLATLSFTAGS
jgi:hypothetical protein